MQIFSPGWKRRLFLPFKEDPSSDIPPINFITLSLFTILFPTYSPLLYFFFFQPWRSERVVKIVMVGWEIMVNIFILNARVISQFYDCDFELCRACSAIVRRKMCVFYPLYFRINYITENPIKTQNRTVLNSIREKFW